MRWFLLSATLLLACLAGCSRGYRNDLDYSYDVVQTWSLDGLQYGEIVQFETVFWEPDDTVSLRELITEEGCASGRKVLEIGTGTGVLGILCLQNGADQVVATDINPAAVQNARYNAAMLAADVEMEVRQVDQGAPGAFTVIKPQERFDLILSNPPWENGQVNGVADHAYIDPGFALMDSLLDGLPQHLNPGGRCLLAYGNVSAIKRLKVQAAARGLQFKILDERSIDELEENFLPGMLIEIRVPMGLPSSPAA
jgi:methylase of polypeptide subunit release factors